jgi:hypothetical protein
MAFDTLRTACGMWQGSRISHKSIHTAVQCTNSEYGLKQMPKRGSILEISKLYGNHTENNNKTQELPDTTNGIN